MVQTREGIQYLDVSAASLYNYILQVPISRVITTSRRVRLLARIPFLNSPHKLIELAELFVYSKYIRDIQHILLGRREKKWRDIMHVCIVLEKKKEVFCVLERRRRRRQEGKSRETRKKKHTAHLGYLAFVKPLPDPGIPFYLLRVQLPLGEEADQVHGVLRLAMGAELGFHVFVA